ncbi:MAG TPA: lipoyl domain-containing protein [Acidimicrobiales bacterium]|nr:lipoyl domain-containing protein [Acidimicrobiales bacterium]
MSTPLRVPQAGAAMDEGTIIEWVVADGTPVTAGQVVYRLDTDKTELDVEAPVGGVLRITAPAGGTYPVGAEVGLIE